MTVEAREEEFYRQLKTTLLQLNKLTKEWQDISGQVLWENPAMFDRLMLRLDKYKQKRWGEE